MTDHDLAAAIGFGLIPVLALLFVIAKWLTDPRMAFPILSVIAILAVSFFIGSAMQSANLKWVAVAASGVGKAWPEYNAEAFGRKLASWTREKLKTFERENAKKVPVYVGLSLRSDPITQEARRSFENGAA